MKGVRNAKTIAIEDQGVEAGNKIIVNLGKVHMYGKKRSFKMTRLKKEAKKGDKTITIETSNVDLVKDDKIALAATAIAHDKGEFAVVEKYDKGTGVVTLKAALKFYHFGASASTAAKYNGVDVRGEVVSLTRNVRIVGEDVESWGCQLLTADIMEADGKPRIGELKLDSIEMEQCG